MARLQDFQSVTPQDTDKLLIVQATGQGLATIANIASKIFGLKTAADLKLNSSSGAPTTENAINNASSDSSISFTPEDATKVSLTNLTAYRNGAALILNLYLTANTTITANSEWRIGTFSGINTSLGAIVGAVVNRADSKLLGSYCLTSGNQRLYINMNSNVASGTNLYLTVVTFTA